MTEKESLSDKIEKARLRLYKVAAEKNYHFTDDEVADLSAELDELIVEYQLATAQYRETKKQGTSKDAISNNSYPDRPVWAEIDLEAIAHNVRQFKGCIQDNVLLCAVVKADAYGHGVLETARRALLAGANYLAVAILEEALELRQAGITAPILVLSYTNIEDSRLVVVNDISQTVYTLEAAKALSEAACVEGKRVKVHIKVDTGMGRLGVMPKEADAFAVKIARMPGIDVEGVYSHFANADSRDISFARQQFEQFTDALNRIATKGLVIPIRHMANTAGILSMPEAHLDMVRLGIGLYGLWPSGEMKQTITLRPAMKVMARVIHVKLVPAGTPISYGCTYVTSKRRRIATLPVGYADGWSRLLSGRASVLLHGQRAPVVGRICMDHCMVDVTRVPNVATGDSALLFGGEQLPVEEIAGIIGTINYEIVCQLGKRVPRYYIN